jgi:hypothetical protein
MMAACRDKTVKDVEVRACRMLLADKQSYTTARWNGVTLIQDDGTLSRIPDHHDIPVNGNHLFSSQSR